MDPVALVQGALAPLQRARDAIQGVAELKTTLRQRYGDYSSIIESLKSKPEVIAATKSERELLRLTELFTRVADLIGEYTAAPGDSKAKKASIKAKRAADWENVNKELHEIDADVMRQLGIMSLNGVVTSSEMKVLQRVDEKVERLTSLVEDMRPPNLPDMAAVPAGALVLPHSYVERAAVQEVADGLTSPQEPRTPYTVVGIGGGGKSVLASAVVRKSSVREHYRGGIFWMRVGRGAESSLLALLQGLAREMGAAPTDAPHGVPHVLDSLEKVKQHFGAVASTGDSPRLVVLDDVWEREVVDAILPLGLKVLVTTRDRSVVGVPTGCLKLGDMTEEEALELLLKTSGTVGQPGDGVRTQMTKVVTRCGRLPLVLAIAGSMPVVKGKGLTAGTWEELVKLFENKAAKMWECGEQTTNLGLVLETSFTSLSARKKDAFLKTAVLAPGAVASTEMLLNLWETKDTGGTQEEAEGLVGKCLLQDVGGGGYRVHDLVLDFVKIKIKADGEMVKKATALQVAYLRRLDVLEDYREPMHGADNQGWFVLGCFWRCVEELSGDPELEVASYGTSLGELEPLVYCDAISLPSFLPSFLQSFLPFSPNLRDTAADVAASYSSVGRFFSLQENYTEAIPLLERALEIRRDKLEENHPDTVSARNNLEAVRKKV